MLRGGSALRRWSARVFGEGLQYAGAIPGGEGVDPCGQVLTAFACQRGISCEGREHVGLGASLVPAVTLRANYLTLPSSRRTANRRTSRKFWERYSVMSPVTTKTRL